jgi:hypothetical protein
MIRFLFKLICGTMAFALMGIGSFVTALALSDNATGLERPSPHIPFVKEGSQPPAHPAPVVARVARVAPVAPRPAAPAFHRLAAGTSLAGWTRVSQFALEVGEDDVRGWVGVERVKWSYDGRWIRGRLSKRDVAIEVGVEWLKGKMGEVAFAMRRPDFVAARVPPPAVTLPALAAPVLPVASVVTVSQSMPLRPVQAMVIPNLGPKCAIATALSGRGEDVMLFRQYRDQVLSRSIVGHRMAEVYYQTSPKLAQVLHSSPTARRAMHAALIPVMAYVRSRVTK